MLRRWNRSLSLVVSASSVRAELFGGWPKQRSIARASWLIEPTAGASRGATIALAIDRALALLESSGHALNGVPVSLGLPDSLVVYDVACGEFGALSNKRIGEIVNASIAELMQLPVNEVQTKWQLQRGGQSAVVCGIARATLDPMRTVFEKRRMRMQSVLPAFVALWNARRTEVRALPAIIAATRGSHALLAAVDERGIFAIEPAQMPLVDWTAVRTLAEGFAVALGLDAELGVHYYLDVEFPVPRTSARWRAINDPAPVTGALAGAAA